MSKKFIDVYNMQGGGAIGLLRPSLLDVGAKHIINAYAQEPCVFRFVKTNLSATEAIRLTLEAPNGQTIETYVNFARSTTQYYDITEPIRCWIGRNTQNLTIALTYTQFRLTLTEYDANNAEIDTTDYIIRAYDAVEPLDVKFDSFLPDTFRLLASASVSQFETACARAATSACIVDVVLSNGTVQTNYTGAAGDLYTAGWRFLYNSSNPPAVVRVGAETARVDWIRCADNMAQLRWWSPSCGGFKSVAVELLSSVATLSGGAAYIKDFDNVFAASMAGGLKARIPLCTMRDVMYYRDLYISDEVEMAWKTDVYSYSKRIKIDGEIPEVTANGTVDMNMTLRLSEVSTAW